MNPFAVALYSSSPADTGRGPTNWQLMGSPPETAGNDEYWARLSKLFRLRRDWLFFCSAFGDRAVEGESHEETNNERKKPEPFD